MRRGALAVTLSAGLMFGGACSASQEGVQPSPQTISDLTPTTLEKQTLVNRANELWVESTMELRQKIGNVATQLLVARKSCLYWPTPGGYTVIKEPVMYTHNDINEQLAMLVFINGLDRNHPAAMNGPFEYARIGASGLPDPNQAVSNIDAVTFQSTAATIMSPETIVPKLASDGNSGWIVDAKGEKIDETFVVTEDGLSAKLIELCGQDFSSNTPGAI